MGYIDLHIHTTASDGSCTPVQVVEMAADIGLEGIAITDHDSVSGVVPAAEAAKHFALELVPGIELSSEFEGREIHILGYFIDIASEPLFKAAAWSVDDRNKRNEKMISMLRRDGYNLSIDELREKNPCSVLGRPHIAQGLVEIGAAASVKDAFRNFLGEGGKYYLPRHYLSMERAVGAIRAAGGAAVIAHPLLYRFDDKKLRRMISCGKSLGVVGLEAEYSRFTKREQSSLKNLAKSYGLIYTGGSDFHGSGKPDIKIGTGTGGLHIDSKVLEILKASVSKETLK